MTSGLIQNELNGHLECREIWVEAFLIPPFYKETLGSLKFPSYPFECMPWSMTTVVSIALVIACNGLMPSVVTTTSAFSHALINRRLSKDHDNILFEAQYTACILDHVRLRTPVTGLTLGLLL